MTTGCGAAWSRISPITVRHGIRNEDDPDARFSQMPAFGEMLDADEIATLVDHVRALPGVPMPWRAQVASCSPTIARPATARTRWATATRARPT